MGVKVISYSPAVLYPVDFAHPEEMEIEVVSDYSGKIITDKYVWIDKDGEIYTKEEALATLNKKEVTDVRDLDSEPSLIKEFLEEGVKFVKYSMGERFCFDYADDNENYEGDPEYVLEYFGYTEVETDELEPDDPEEPDTDFLFEQERDARYEEECK